METNKTQLSILFNEWNKRYSEDPVSFSDTLDEEGNPVEDYGDLCAVYFEDLKKELFE